MIHQVHDSVHRHPTQGPGGGMPDRAVANERDLTEDRSSRDLTDAVRWNRNDWKSRVPIKIWRVGLKGSPEKVCGSEACGCARSEGVIRSTHAVGQRRRDECMPAIRPHENSWHAACCEI